MTQALDLFRGAGGWSVACQRLGITDFGVENMKEANATAALAGHQFAWEDVWQPSGYHWLYEGLIGSPPCQTFSLAGSGKGRLALDAVLSLLPEVRGMSLPELRQVGTSLLGDERTALVLTPLWYALHGDFRWLAFEQVPTVLSVWEACATELRKVGWNIWTGYLHAEQYGVPQTRKRAFLIGSRDHEVGMPTPTHSRYYSRTPDKLDIGVKKWVSMAEALGWDGDGYMRSNYGTGGDASRRGERPLSQPAPTVTSKIDRNEVRWREEEGWHYRSSTMPNSAKRPIDAPAPTIAFGHDAASAQWVRESRNDGIRVTIQEAGILQSFPADYSWQGAKGKQYLQVGNAVPPLLAEAVLLEAMQP